MQEGTFANGLTKRVVSARHAKVDDSDQLALCLHVKGTKEMTPQRLYAHVRNGSLTECALRRSLIRDLVLAVKHLHVLKRKCNCAVVARATRRQY